VTERNLLQKRERSEKIIPRETAAARKMMGGTAETDGTLREICRESKKVTGAGTPQLQRQFDKREEEATETHAVMRAVHGGKKGKGVGRIGPGETIRVRGWDAGGRRKPRGKRASNKVTGTGFGQGEVANRLCAAGKNPPSRVELRAKDVSKGNIKQSTKEDLDTTKREKAR